MIPKSSRSPSSSLKPLPQFEQRNQAVVQQTGHHDAPVKPAENLSGPFTLPPLPYDKGALAPFISPQTLSFHHGKHHKAYVDKANSLIAAAGDADLCDTVIEHVVVRAARRPELAELFNTAAQAWNHAFFWQCLTPDGGGAPDGVLAQKLAADLGGATGFAEKFQAAAAAQFGSGWAWLVLDNGKLRVTTTGNADTPLVHGQIPLLALDVWEHAYYLDYQNRRPDYIKAVIDHLLNWDFATANLARALGKDGAGKLH